MSDSARINLTNCKSNPFELYENLNISNQDKYLNTGNQQRTKLSDMYYSQANIDHVQNEIVSQIYKKTDGKYKITKQS